MGPAFLVNSAGEAYDSRSGTGSAAQSALPGETLPLASIGATRRATAGIPSCVAEQVTRPSRNREARTPSRS
jgi:hypothetical protein